MNIVNSKSNGNQIVVDMNERECEEAFEFTWHPSTVWLTVDTSTDEVIDASIESMAMPPMREVMSPKMLIDQLAAKRSLYDSAIEMANERAKEL